MILSAKEKVRLALGDLLVEVTEPVDDLPDEAELMREIEMDFHGQPPLSDTIIDERRKGP